MPSIISCNMNLSNVYLYQLQGVILTSGNFLGSSGQVLPFTDCCLFDHTRCKHPCQELSSDSISNHSDNKCYGVWQVSFVSCCNVLYLQSQWSDWLYECCHKSDCRHQCVCVFTPVYLTKGVFVWDNNTTQYLSNTPYCYFVTMEAGFLLVSHLCPTTSCFPTPITNDSSKTSARQDQENTQWHQQDTVLSYFIDTE